MPKVAARLLAASLCLLAASLASGASAAQAAPCSISATLRLGSRSNTVQCLETVFRERGYRNLTGPDTYFGTSTRSAVRSYQRANGLAVDGIVGPRTGAALGIWGASPTQPPIAPAIIETKVIGTSVQGREIVAQRMGTPGGRVVMVVGSIHGDENKGIKITSLLRTLPTPVGIDLWIVDSINPDGVANGTRQNANNVDLNRNFEVGWSYIPASPSHRQYSGEAAADQPETQAMQAFVRQIKPAIAIWYHQDANTITVGGARPVIPTSYAQQVGLSTGNVPCTQRCTGTAGKFVNSSVVGATSFLVELPGSSRVTDAMVRTHASAVLSVITL